MTHEPNTYPAGYVKPPVTIGVDPGATGALAALDADGRLVALWDMPIFGSKTPFVLGWAVGQFVHSLPDVSAAYVEQVASRPGQGVSSTFKFGAAFGGVVSAINAAGVRVELVTPGKWKKAAGLVGQDKNASRRLAAQYWPEWSGAFARVKDADRAEAALIARYGWQHGVTF